MIMLSVASEMKSLTNITGEINMIEPGSYIEYNLNNDHCLNLDILILNNYKIY